MLSILFCYLIRETLKSMNLLYDTMHQNILITTDGSDESMSAVEEGFDIARAYDATVHALYVIDETTRGRGLIGIDHPNPFTTLRQRGKSATDEIKSRGELAGVKVKPVVLEGIPYEAIIEYANTHDIDLIIMSSHGRSGVRRFIFGSVTEHVTRSADQPVVVVRCQPSDDKDHDADSETHRLHLPS